MTTRLSTNSSRRAPAQLPDAVDAEAQSFSPVAAGRPRRQSVAAAMQQMEYQERGTLGPSAFEMQSNVPTDVAADNSKDLSRLKTLGVVQKLNKASYRSKIEGRVFTTIHTSNLPHQTVASSP
jgi:hypothetical protein